MDEPNIAPDINPAPLSPAAPSAFAPVAPYWHTALVLAIMVSVGILSAKTFELRGQTSEGPMGQYLSTMLWLWLLSALVYMGLRRRGVPLRDVIGGEWRGFDDLLIDLAIAGGFWLSSAIALAVLKLIFMRGQLANIQTLPEQAKSLAPIIPHTPREMLFWVLLSITAGLCEEFVFRGYLQRQFSALTRNAAAGIALSALFFSVGHLYQGFAQMAFIGLYGAMFGTLAHFRRSLRPGMIAHAWQDTLAGLALGILLPHAAK